MATTKAKDTGDIPEVPGDPLRQATETTALREQLAATEAARAQLAGIVVPQLTRARAQVTEAARAVAEAAQEDRQSGVASWRHEATFWAIPMALVEQHEAASAAITAAAGEREAFTDAIEACGSATPTDGLVAEVRRLLGVPAALERHVEALNGARGGNKLTGTQGLRAALAAAKNLEQRRGEPVGLLHAESARPKTAIIDFKGGMPR